jgi:hypothetical protein
MDDKHPAKSRHSAGPGTGGSRLLDWWFRPRRFETERLYELLGARLLKRYVPTGGDLVMRWLRRRHPGASLLRGATLESLRSFERWTRVAEGVHIVGFMCFAALAGWRFTHGSLGGAGLGVALVLDLAFGLWPVTLQRYNRLRVIRVIETATRISPERATKQPVHEPVAEPARARDEPACSPPSTRLWRSKEASETGER